MNGVGVGDPIRTAVIGYGRAVQLQHGPQVSHTPGYALSAIVTRDRNHAELAHRSFPQAQVVDSVDEIWANRDQYDLVVIATPNDTHVPLAREAIHRNIAVVIEKPIATTAESARQLIDEARDSGVPLTVFQNRRWDGDYLTVKSLIEQRALGEVYEFESRFTWWDPKPAQSWKTRASVREGGGAVYDLGPHLIDQAVRLFGPVVEWYAELDSRRSAAASDDDSLVLLTHDNGVRSRLWMSCVSAQSGPRFRVAGSAGAFTKFGLDPQEEQASKGMSPSDPGFGVEEESSWGLLGVDGDTVRVPTERGSYTTFFEILGEALRGNGEVPVDPEDSVAVVELIEEIHGSRSKRLRGMM